jgi:hypothetical protein
MQRLLNALTVAVLGVGLAGAVALVGSLSATNVEAKNPEADACIRTLKFADGKGIQVNPGGNAKSMVKLDKGCGHRDLVMKAWYAPSASGVPHDEQWQYQVSNPVRVTPADNNHWTTLKVDMPDAGCFYQVDLVDMTHPDTTGQGNPIVAAVTGGNRDCRPIPDVSCTQLDVIKSDDRQVAVSNFTYKAVHATLHHVDINWGDYTPVQTYAGNPMNVAHHPFAADGEYLITATPYFSYTNKFGNLKVKAAPACTATVKFTPKTTPGEQIVCDLTTKKIVTIPEGPFDTAKYSKNLKDCETPETPKHPPTPKTPKELPHTGLGSLMSIIGAGALTASTGYWLTSRRRS